MLNTLQAARACASTRATKPARCGWHVPAATLPADAPSRDGDDFDTCNWLLSSLELRRGLLVQEWMGERPHPQMLGSVNAA